MKIMNRVLIRFFLTLNRVKLNLIRGQIEPKLFEKINRVSIAAVRIHGFFAAEFPSNISINKLSIP